MVAPQLGNGVHVLLAQPDHVGTQVLILGTFLLLERAPRRWYTPVALWALLTVAIVADKIVIVDAVVPLAFTGLLHAVWTRRPSAHRFELSLAIAAGASVGHRPALLTLIGRPRRVRPAAGADRPGSRLAACPDTCRWPGTGC